MKPRFLPLFLLVLPLLPTAPVAASGPTVTGAPNHNAAWLSSKKDAFDRARKEKKLVILDAFANWCGWCKKLDKDVLDTPQFVESTKAGYVLLRLNTEDGRDGSELAQRYGISNLPTTLVFDHDENVVGRIGGYVKYEEFQRSLQQFKTSWSELQTKETDAKGKRSKDVPFLLDLAREWETRSNFKRAAALYSGIADQKTATADQRAHAAWSAGVIALRMEKVDEAERRLRQLDATRPMPADLKGLPELLRSDIAAMRGDLDSAISILEELLGSESAGDWKNGLPQRIAELKARRQAAGTRRTS